jgi:hypothetical protein
VSDACSRALDLTVTVNGKPISVTKVPCALGARHPGRCEPSVRIESVAHHATDDGWKTGIVWTEL